MSLWHSGPACLYGTQGPHVSMAPRARMSLWHSGPACLYGVTETWPACLYGTPRGHPGAAAACLCGPCQRQQVAHARVTYPTGRARTVAANARYGHRPHSGHGDVGASSRRTAAAALSPPRRAPSRRPLFRVFPRRPQPGCRPRLPTGRTTGRTTGGLRGGSDRPNSGAAQAAPQAAQPSHASSAACSPGLPPPTPHAHSRWRPRRAAYM